MTPDFDELSAATSTPEERARLRRAHDLLLAAGPPPELRRRSRTDGPPMQR